MSRQSPPRFPHPFASLLRDQAELLWFVAEMSRAAAAVDKAAQDAWTDKEASLFELRISDFDAVIRSQHVST